MGSMFSGNRMSKEEMEVVVNKAKEIVSAYPVVVFRFVLVEISHLFHLGITLFVRDYEFVEKIGCCCLEGF